jgi:hypothetical protein
MATQKLDEDGYSARLDDNLRLLSGTGGDIGKRPSCFELYQGVRRLEEFDETADDASLDNTLNRRIALFR